MAANTDKAFQALLDLIKEHPDLITQMVFNPASIRTSKAVPPYKAVQKLAEGVEAPKLVDAPTFLAYMGSPADGYAAAQCLEQTKSLCGKGTLFAVASCGGATGHNLRPA